MRALAGSATIATTALLLTAIAPAAQAAKNVHHDPAGDIVQIDVEGEVVTPAPEESEGDITKFVVDHRSDKIVIKATFVDLHTPEASVLYYLPVKTNEGLRRNIILNTDPDHRQGEIDLSGSGPCNGLQRTVSYADDLLTIKLPRSCMSKPEWVRVGLGMMRDSELKGGIPVGFIDDAMVEGDFGRDKPQLGPKVFRG